MLYDYDRFAAATEEPVTVKVFKDGAVHEMRTPPLKMLMDVTAMLSERVQTGGMTTDDIAACIELVTVSFPTLESSGELALLDASQVMTLVRLIRDGDLPSDLGPRTAEGNGCTEAAEVSPSPSLATPAPTVKTRKRSGNDSRKAN